MPSDLDGIITVISLKSKIESELSLFQLIVGELKDKLECDKGDQIITQEYIFNDALSSDIEYQWRKTFISKLQSPIKEKFERNTPFLIMKSLPNLSDDGSDSEYNDDECRYRFGGLIEHHTKEKEDGRKSFVYDQGSLRMRVNEPRCPPGIEFAHQNGQQERQTQSGQQEIQPQSVSSFSTNSWYSIKCDPPNMLTVIVGAFGMLQGAK